MLIHKFQVIQRVKHLSMMAWFPNCQINGTVLLTYTSHLLILHMSDMIKTLQEKGTGVQFEGMRNIVARV